MRLPINEVSERDTFAFKGRLTIRTFKDGKLVRRVGPFYNKVVCSEGYGRNLILRALTPFGDSIVINAAKLGTGDTAPSDEDTDLASPETDFLDITDWSVAEDTLNIDVFVPDANLPDDTYSEFGLFIGSALFSRLLITPDYTKGEGEDTLFSYELIANG